MEILEFVIISIYSGVAMTIASCLIQDDINQRARYWRPKLLENPFL